MEQVYAYLRVSSQQQSAENSFEYQQGAIERYCAVHGYEVIHYFKDVAKSGTSLKNRSGLEALIKTSRNKENPVRKCLIFKLERMFRSTIDGLLSLKELFSNGCEVISTQEDLRDQFNLQLNLILAERYSAQLSGYTINSMTSIAKNHQKYLGGPVLYGYLIDSDGHYVKHPEQSKAVEIIFTLFAQRKSYSYISRYLNELHIYNSKNQPWSETSSSTMYGILKNPKYYGLYNYGKHSKSKFSKTEYVEKEGGCYAIVSKELFEECNELLEQRKHKGGKFTAKQTYLLSSSNILKCGICGSNIHGGSHGSAKPWATYRCSKKSKCTNKELNKEYVDTLAVQILAKYLNNKNTVKLIVDQVNSLIIKSQDDESIVNILKNNLSKSEKSIENLMSALESGLVSENVTSRLHTLEKEKQAIEEKLMIENTKKRTIQAIDEKQVKGLLNQAKLKIKDGCDGEIKEVLKMLFSEVTLSRDEVVFRINLTGFFNLDTKLEDTIISFDRDQVIKYKGNLNRLLFRKEQSEKSMFS